MLRMSFTRATMTRGAPAVCRAVKCRQCGKTTWAGCGQHVDMVLRGVPAADRCAGHQREAGEAGSGFFGRLFGR